MEPKSTNISKLFERKKLSVNCFTVWSGFIFVIAFDLCELLFKFTALNSCGTLAALQNKTKALLGCDNKSANIFKVILKFSLDFFKTCQTQKVNKTQFRQHILTQPFI